MHKSSTETSFVGDILVTPDCMSSSFNKKYLIIQNFCL